MPTLPPAVAALSEGLPWRETWARYVALGGDPTPEEGKAALLGALNAILIARPLAMAIEAMSTLRRAQTATAMALEAGSIALNSIRPDTTTIQIAGSIAVEVETPKAMGPDPLSQRVRAIADSSKAASVGTMAEIKAQERVDRCLRSIATQIEYIRHLSPAERLSLIAEQALETNHWQVAAELYDRATPRNLTPESGLLAQASAVARAERAYADGSVPERM